MLTSKPGWIGGLVEGNDGAFWAPALLDDRNMLYSVPSPFDDEGGASCLAWIRYEFTSVETGCKKATYKINPAFVQYGGFHIQKHCT